MTNLKARKANSSLWNERLDRISTIKEVNKTRMRLTREFQTDRTGWHITDLVVDFNSTVKSMNLETLYRGRDGFPKEFNRQVLRNIPHNSCSAL